MDEEREESPHPRSVMRRCPHLDSHQYQYQ
jgi:hypothetical protein